ncbi:MAG: 1-aminocyclopropane-1-carboxylate deaminase/D-cysteine desulfhydrase, partial [Bacteroidota bacterium]
FSKTYQIPIEPIYTGKMFWGIFDLVEQGFFKKKSVILAVHTGGLRTNT